MAALVPARRGTRSPRPGRGAGGVGRGRDAAEKGTDARARLGGDLRRGTRRGNRGLCEGARRAAREVAQHRAARAAPRGGECATLEDAKRPANGSGWRVLPRNACHLDAFMRAIRCRVAAEREADSLISDDDAPGGEIRVRREPTSPPAGRSRRESIAASHSRAGFAPPSHTASRRRRQRARLVALRARRSE